MWRETGQEDADNREHGDQLSLVSGEEAVLECVARGAHPAPGFVWSVPDHDGDQQMVTRAGMSVSRLTYIASAGDHGKVVRCSTVQTGDRGQVLYKVTTNLTLSITAPAPLLSSSSSHIGIVTGVLLAFILVIIIISIALFIVKKKKRLVSSKERANTNRIAAAESKIEIGRAPRLNSSHSQQSRMPSSA